MEVEHGFLKLYNRNVNFVGGRVDKIADNWELRKVCVIENKTHKMLTVELEFIIFFGGGVWKFNDMPYWKEVLCA